FKYVLYDVMRSRMVAIYMILLLLLSQAIFWLGADSAKSVVSLLHLVLLVVPLISIVFGTIHYYNSREFIELLLSQPLTRNKVFLSEYLGVSVSLAIAFLLGAGIPMLINGINIEGLYLLGVGVIITFIFTALAYAVSVVTNDKPKGMGISLLLWFYFAVLFDGIVLFILFYFNDYPLEKAVIALASLNPLDLGRILILLKIDTSALMGYTGALYQKFFGTGMGTFYSVILLGIWLFIPLLVAKRKFSLKDL
ncbi:MAG: ABC transporter permease, partial [Candidatus Paceibacterales bacterium]